jgi:hypothetical protein
MEDSAAPTQYILTAHVPNDPNNKLAGFHIEYFTRAANNDIGHTKNKKLAMILKPHELERLVNALRKSKFQFKLQPEVIR